MDDSPHPSKDASLLAGAVERGVPLTPPIRSMLARARFCLPLPLTGSDRESFMDALRAFTLCLSDSLRSGRLPAVLTSSAPTVAHWRIRASGIKGHSVVLVFIIPKKKAPQLISSGYALVVLENVSHHLTICIHCTSIWKPSVTVRAIC